MVKALVVLEASIVPFINGRTAVVPLADGVASFSTVCVWPLCNAGLAHGSASMLSKESFRRRRDFEGESGEDCCLEGDVGSWDSGDVLSELSDAFSVLNRSIRGNDG